MCRESLVDNLSFSFCVPPQPHPHTSSLQITRLQNSDDIRVAGQSHGVILKAQHRQTTSLKSKRQSPLRSLKFPTVITSRASRFPCEILPTAFFSTKNKREEKKQKNKKTPACGVIDSSRNVLLGGLFSLWWDDHRCMRL